MTREAQRDWFGWALIALLVAVLIFAILHPEVARQTGFLGVGCR